MCRTARGKKRGVKERQKRGFKNRKTDNTHTSKFQLLARSCRSKDDIFDSSTMLSELMPTSLNGFSKALALMYQKQTKDIFFLEMKRFFFFLMKKCLHQQNCNEGTENCTSCRSASLSAKASDKAKAESFRLVSPSSKSKSESFSSLLFSDKLLRRLL